MTSDDASEFSGIWKGMGEVYGREISECAMLIAFRVLSKLAITEIRLAAEAYMGDPQSGTFMPVPSQIIALVCNANQRTSFYEPVSQREEKMEELADKTEHETWLRQMRKLKSDFKISESKERPTRDQMTKFIGRG